MLKFKVRIRIERKTHFKKGIKFNLHTLNSGRKLGHSDWKMNELDAISEAVLEGMFPVVCMVGH